MKKVDFSVLRSPLLLIGVLSIYTLPEFVTFCITHEEVTDFWSAMAACGQEFVYQSFFRTSIWSFFHIVLVSVAIRVFQSAFGLDTAPLSLRQWLTALFKLGVLAVSIFGLYYLMNLLVLKTVPQHALIDQPTQWSLLMWHSLFLTLLFYSLAYIQSFWAFKKDPLAIEIPILESVSGRPIQARDIKWIEKKGNDYLATTQNGELRIGSNLQTLERLLSPKFFARINRSVIANLNCITNYNYWEHEKYVLKMTGGQEFVITRKRLVELKDKLAKR